jgi:hypothetical protein
VGVGLATLRGPFGTSTTLVSHRGELRTDVRLGPLGLALAAHSRAVATLGELAAGYAVASGVSVDTDAPLVREMGSNDAPLQHWVTPFATGTAGLADVRAPSVVSPLARDGMFYAAGAGVRSTFGQSAGRRSAVTTAVQAGAVGDARDLPVSVMTWTAGARALAIALRGEATTVLGSTRATSLVSELRVGREDGPFVAGPAFGGDGAVPVASRLLALGWDAPWAALLGSPGWSAGGGIGVPWASWLASSADADVDVTTGDLLGVRGTVAYRHPCGCLAVTAWAAHRMGRPLLDSWVTVDLVP